jgi:hypothetical protein
VIAAIQQAIDRVAEHFTLPDLIEEFRAIRAAVLKEVGGSVKSGRFNETIDEAKDVLSAATTKN